jgi:hypothetical protein
MTAQALPLARSSERQFIDADSHIIEPEDLFTSRVSAKWGDLVPHVRFDAEHEEDVWYIGGDRAGALQRLGVGLEQSRYQTLLEERGI